MFLEELIKARDQLKREIDAKEKTENRRREDTLSLLQEYRRIQETTKEYILKLQELTRCVDDSLYSTKQYI